MKLKSFLPFFKKKEEIRQTKKLTEEDILNMIEKTEFSKMGVKTTVCLVTLKNGFEILTSSSCIDPEAYNQTLGEHLSYRRAIDRIRELEGYERHNQK